MSELPPTEVPWLYLRQTDPGGLTELVIDFGHDMQEVYMLRPTQLAVLAVDATRFALARYLQLRDQSS
jgi:hypothetical protein